MMMANTLVLLVVVSLIQFCFTMDPLTLTVAGASAAAGIAIWNQGYCKVRECCTPSWTRHAVDKLGEMMDQRLFGQHIAREVILRTITQHVENENPSKALVLSFHGPSGTGKNHIANIITDALYYKGADSKYVKKIIATHSFPMQDRPSFYIEKFRSMIVNTVKQCDRSLIVLDEVHNMPDGLLGYIKMFLDNHESVDGVDYRKSIFLLMSTIGEKEINARALTQWQEAMPREEIQRLEMHNLIAEVAFNYEGGGYFHSDLVKHNLIDFFVGFLPLEKSHVRSCIKAEIARRGKRKPNEEKISQLAGQVLYQPKVDLVFSVSGCRKIDKLVDLYY